jgi:hypothetical protein
MNIGEQIAFLFILAIPIASIAWTITHEEIFREARDWCKQNSEMCDRLYKRKFFYLFTCEYCFSHYVVIFFLILTRYKLLFPDWRGYVISGFSLVWVANVYMNLYSHVRLDIKRERVEIAEKENSIAAPEPSPPVVLTAEGASKEAQPDAVRR